MERIVDTENVASWLIHADSKEGKSTLTSTAPFPHLVLDAEGSWKFIDQQGYLSGWPLRKRPWNPMTEPIPRWDDTWDVCRVHVDSWQTMQQVYLALTQFDHDFVSLTVDSITEAQRRAKANIRTGSAMMDQQAWGRLLDAMDALIRGFRDLTLMPNTLRCVIFVAETAMKDGRWRPFMQGQIRDTLPYFVDGCGFLYTEMRPAGDQQVKVKRMLIGAGVSAAHIVGERFQGRLPDIIDNPNFNDMMNLIYPKEN